MKYRLIVLILALACGGQCFSASATRFRVDANDNLRYQLDCLAGLIRCTRVETALSQEISRNPVASEKLDAWRDTRQQQSGTTARATRSRSALPPITDLVVNSGRETNGSRRLTQRRGEFDDPLEHQLLAYFSPAFQRDWQEFGALLGGNMRAQLRWLGGREDVANALDRIAVFLHSDNIEPPVATLIALPDSGRGSIATLDADTIYLETPLGDSANNRLPVLAHEYVHFWLSHHAQRVSQQLASAFADSDQPCSVVAFGIFEEAIASALGNGIIEQQLNSGAAFREYLAIPDSFYADRNIDAVAKAVLPDVIRYIADGKALDDAFVAIFIDRTARTLGDRCASIALQMRTSAMVLSGPALAEAGQLARQQWRSATMFTDVSTGSAGNTALEHYQALPGAILTTANALTDMHTLPDGLRLALQRIAGVHRRFVYAWPRSNAATVYVVVGDTEDATANTLVQLLALRKQQFNGLWVPPALPGP